MSGAVHWGLTHRPKQVEMILGTIQKECVRCGEPTYWSAPRQRGKGFCLHHALPDEVTEMAAINAIMEVFDEVTVEFDYDPPRPVLEPVEVTVSGTWHARWAPYYRRVTMLPPEAGPCEGCRRPVRRYGPGSYAYCQECRP